MDRLEVNLVNLRIHTLTINYSLYWGYKNEKVLFDAKYDGIKCNGPVSISGAVGSEGSQSEEAIDLTVNATYRIIENGSCTP